MSKSKTGLARIRPMDASPSVQQGAAALSQAMTRTGGGMMGDTLVNLMTGMGTEKDKLTGTVFGYNALAKGQLDAAYRGDWISRKTVDIPAFDSFREWRSWQADKKDITEIEKLEKKLKLIRKSMLGNIRGRLYGGGALLLGVDQGISSDELIIENVKKDQLKFVHAVSRYEMSSGQINYDPMSPYFGEPDYYTINSKSGGTSLKVHPSRVVRFCGAEAADPNITDGWGDSILQICADAIIACGTVTQSTAQLVQEAKIDIVKIPELATSIANTDYEARLKRRFGLAATMKSVFGMLVVDAAEEWTRINQTFTGLDELLKMYLLIVCGAADIPATRFLGQSPAGLSATGESDIRNYYDRLSAAQNIEISPAMERLDRVLVRSALGDEPEGIFYEWNALWQPTESEKAEIAVKKASVMKSDVDAGLITPLVLQKARENQLIEDQTYPGLEQLIEEFGDTVDERAEADAEAARLAAEAAGLDPNAPPDPNAPDDPNAPPQPANENGPKPPKGRAANNNQEATPPPVKKAAGAGKPTRDSKRRAKAAQEMNDRIRAAMADATPRTLYMRRDVLNPKPIKAWAKAQGFKASLDDMHVTILYSKTPVDWLKLGEDYFGSETGKDKLVIKAGGPRVMEKFGKAIVLAFANSELAHRHRSAMYRGEEHGISYEHEEYTPHITITYDGGDLDILHLQAYQGEIILGPEIFEEIKTGFNNEVDVKES